MSVDFERYIDIPEYYKRFCDPDVDLNIERSIPCKFHNEQHGKSFSYSPEKHIFRCWGQCHCGGGVVQLHKLNFHLRTDEEAEESLCAILGIEPSKKEFGVLPEVHVNEENVKLRTLTARAIRKAKSVDQWLELDYIMSKVPVSVEDLEVFCNK